MVVVQCSVPGCAFVSADVSEALAIALLSNHGLAHQPLPVPATPPQASSPAGPKLERPTVDVGVSIEEWNLFTRRWEVFCAGSGITDAQAPFQLFQCAGPDLGDSLLQTNPDAATGPAAALLSAMRSLAVIPVAACVLRTELLQLHQEREETFRAFAARVRGKAETCAFHTACVCGRDVDYSDHIVRDVLINGIYDTDIRRETLGFPDVLNKTVNEVIALVENREIARNALPPSSLSAVSSFRRQTGARASTAPPSADVNMSQRAACRDCKGIFNVFTEGPRGWNSKPHQVCLDCFRAHRRGRRRQPAPDGQQAAVSAGPIAQISLVDSGSGRRRRRGRHEGQHQHSTLTPSGAMTGPARLPHHIFTKGEWRRARMKEHPRVSIQISVDGSVRPGGGAGAPRPQRDDCVCHCRYWCPVGPLVFGGVPQVWLFTG
ncbi:uncharacterized protein LOC127531147 [Acanthochromis polyacanthus]|uniref:uncharacterized protein LOC127531147 n=1 Tax=Acanthochromis polyacanthus TaxID=80966 RepID=UPI002234AA15|nr:uncharacterized protein LOC127531147 [Acanthochromis polyacanthus]